MYNFLPFSLISLFLTITCGAEVHPITQSTSLIYLFLSSKEMTSILSSSISFAIFIFLTTKYIFEILWHKRYLTANFPTSPYPKIIYVLQALFILSFTAIDTDETGISYNLDVLLNFFPHESACWNNLWSSHVTPFLFNASS